MRRFIGFFTMFVAVVFTAIVLTREPLRVVRADDDNSDNNQSRSVQGLAITPVPLKFKESDRQLVGLGSYLVNAVGSCNDCHSCPSYTPGDNPNVLGGARGSFNAASFLAGGVHFGPTIVSPDLTPDVNGNPALTFAQFFNAMTLGKDPDPTTPNRILQVMPWPVTRHMLNGDLRAVYAYLTAIPHRTPGTCTGAGQ
jgi:hypothetical protein